jgi:hypothetical protein
MKTIDWDAVSALDEHRNVMLGLMRRGDWEQFRQLAPKHLELARRACRTRPGIRQVCAGTYEEELRRTEHRLQAFRAKNGMAWLRRFLRFARSVAWQGVRAGTS